jgi:uncharacterized protein YqjF (DUF2071 family)
MTTPLAVSLSERLEPARRPHGLPVGYQNWRRLFFVHWAISPLALRPLVPDALTIDEFDGMAYVSLTPFAVEAARPVAAPAALGLDFLETNVRTYVHLNGAEPGVYFFSLDAASVLAVIGARGTLGLPYFWATGREHRRGNDVDYALRRRICSAGCHLQYQVGEYRGPAAPGTLDHFLIERYLLHVQRGPSLWTVHVHHRPYPLHDVRLVNMTESLVRAAGISGLGEPSAIHFASGVDVEIFPPCIRSAFRPGRWVSCHHAARQSSLDRLTLHWPRWWLRPR